jgi:hypothetical protein
MTDNSGLIADALLKTDKALYDSIDGGNSWKAAIKQRGARTAKFRAYTEGDHDANITNQMRNMLRIKQDDAGLEEFSLNYMEIVIDKMAGRLKVSEVTTDDETQDEYIISLLEYNDFDASQGKWYRGAIRDGDSFVMVDPVTLKWKSESAYDGFSGIVAIFSEDENFPVWACKIWSESDNQNISEGNTSSTAVMKLNVYQPNKITYWKGNVNTQEVQARDNEQKSKGEWKLKHTPIVHFANQINNYTQYGQSELRKAIPAQNAINRTLHSMIMASELSAFRIYWSIGFEIDKSGVTPGAILNLILTDTAGKPISSPTTEQIEFLKASKVGEFSESDISQYTNQLIKLVEHISNITQTPIYGITVSGNLSGEALKQLEIGLIGKIKRFQAENTGAIRAIIELTAEIQTAYGRDIEVPFENPPKLEGISINWQTPEILDVGAAIKYILEIREKAPGLFDDDFIRQQIGGMLGMTQAQIIAEGEKAKNAQSQNLGQLTGAAGTRPLI